MFIDSSTSELRILERNSRNVSLKLQWRTFFSIGAIQEHFRAVQLIHLF